MTVGGFVHQRRACLVRGSHGGWVTLAAFTPTLPPTTPAPPRRPPSLPPRPLSAATRDGYKSKRVPPGRQTRCPAARL